MTERHKLMTTEDHERHHHSDETDEDIEMLPEVLPAHIFDATYCGEAVPEGFDAVRIKIDGSVKADLSWKKEREAAVAYIQQGLRLFWEIDLGIFDTISHPLDHRPQFLSLALSLDHFRDTLLKEFSQKTIGLCLYRGSPDFSLRYLWDDNTMQQLQDWLADLFKTAEAFTQEVGISIKDFIQLNPSLLETSKEGQSLLRLFCRNAVAEYLTLLSARLPNSLSLFLLFDVTTFQEPFEIAQLVTKEHYCRFLLGIKSSLPYAVEMFDGDLPWEGAPTAQGMMGRKLLRNSSDEEERARVGVCLHDAASYLPSLLLPSREAVDVLQQKKRRFRIIPQGNLMAAWEGLDELMINPHCLDPVLERQLNGFRAAGGCVHMANGNIKVY